MHRFSLSYGKLQEEIEKYPRKYAELIALGNARNRQEAAASGQMPITENMPEHLEQIAVESRMRQADVGYNNRIAQLKKAGIM